MMRVLWLLLRLCLASSSLVCSLAADEPVPVPEPDPISVPSIRLPELPNPVGPPAPQPVTVLDAESCYIVESDVPLLVLASPVGFVSVVSDSGPMKIRGKFADGSGKVETRTYLGKYLFTVEAVARGTVEMLVIPAGATDESVVLRRTLSVLGARPPPDPVDPVDPPGPVTGLIRVLIIEETEDRSTLPASQRAVMLGAGVREYCNSHCSKGPDGVTPDFRLLDDDQNVNAPASPQPQWIKDAFKEPRGGVPFLMVSNGTTGFAGPCPATEDEMLTLLRKYGGP